jgi:hypothetical protein
MANTTTQIITAGSVGTTTSPQLPTTLALQVGSNAAGATFKFTAPASGGAPRGEKVFCFYATSPLALAAAAAPAQLYRDAKRVVGNLPADAGGITVFTVPTELVKGGNVYVWFEAPGSLPVAHSVDVFVFETTI